MTRRINFPLAEWEFFTARGEVETGEIVEAEIRNVWTIRYDNGVTRIYGSGSDGPLWLRPQDVPGRVRRGDNHWPRTHPDEWRRIIEAGRKTIQLDADERLEARLEALPEPEVRARPATLAEIPRGAKTIGVKATNNGFDVAATYARGPRVDQYWRATEISDTILIRGRHADGRRFGAMWITKTTGPQAKTPGVTGWEIQEAYLMRDAIWTPCNATELSAYLVTSE